MIDKYLNITGISLDYNPVKRQSLEHACICGKLSQTCVCLQNFLKWSYMMYKHASYFKYLQLLRENAGE